MHINEFLLTLEKNKDLNKFVNSVHPIDLRGDLMQDLLIAVYENSLKNPLLIGQLIADNKVGNYVCRIASLMVKSNTSKFYTTYRKPLPVWNPIVSQCSLQPNISDYAIYLREIDVVLLESLQKTNNSVTLLAKKINVRKNSLLDMVNEMKKKVSIGKSGIETDLNFTIKVKTKDDSQKVSELKSLLQKVMKNQLGNSIFENVLIVDFK